MDMSAGQRHLLDEEERRRWYASRGYDVGQVEPEKAVQPQVRPEPKWIDAEGRDARDFDCAFHVDGVPDAPCICEGWPEHLGSVEIVKGEVVDG